MKKIEKIIALLIINIILIACSSAKVEEEKEPIIPPSQELMGCCFSGKSIGLFDRPVNIGPLDSFAMKESFYQPFGIYSNQSENEKFNDLAPFIEIDPEQSGNNKHERLWFTSSRYPIDDEMVNKSTRFNATNKIQQIYFIDRTIKDFACPNQGWSKSEGNLRVLKTGNANFDKAAKGMATIAKGKMIITAGKFHDRTEGQGSHFQNIYQLTKNTNSLTKEDAPYNNPDLIHSLSSDLTWESEPALSPDGRHLFFVSNRQVMDYNQEYSYTDSNYFDRMHLYYSYLNNEEKWEKPVFVTQLNSEEYNTVAPRLNEKGNVLYFSDNSKSSYDIYQIKVKLNSSGGFSLDNDVEELNILNNEGEVVYQINTSMDERYVFDYYNPANDMEDALIWSSSKKGGWGGYDIYGCGTSTSAVLELYIADAKTCEIITTESPVFELFDGDGNSVATQGLKGGENHSTFRLVKGNSYYAKGGFDENKSNTNEDNSRREFWYKAKDTLDSDYVFSEEKSSTSTKDTFKLKDIKKLKKKINQGVQRDTIYERVEHLGLGRNKITIKEEKYLKEYNIDFEKEVIIATIEETNVVQVNGKRHVFCNLDNQPTGSLISSAQVLSEHSKNDRFEVPKRLSESLLYRDTVYVTYQDYGSIDITYNVVLLDKCKQGRRAYPNIENPMIDISGGMYQKIDSNRFSTKLQIDKEYKVKGGTSSEYFDCDLRSDYTFVGYQRWEPGFSNCGFNLDNPVLTGASVPSVLGTVSTFGITKDSVINDTIYITKKWEEKDACVAKTVKVLGSHNNVAYFQTAFWEVNSSENLNRDLKKLEEDYTILKTEIKSNNSGYKGYGDPIDMVKPSVSKEYSIANARWIELHPYNQYWGYRKNRWTSLDYLTTRLENRQKRIEEYKEYSKKVDKNMSIMKNVITEHFIPIFEELREKQTNDETKLVITIKAYSDQRGVSRGWYIGEPINYRRTVLKKVGDKITFPTSQVSVVAPKVDESKKTLLTINSENKLGINNVVLSKLRAWYGYKEIFKLLKEDKVFSKYLKSNAVALPDNDRDYKDVDIIVLANGLEIPYGHEYYKGLTKTPYPPENGGEGIYEYDQVRRIEIDINIINYDDKKVEFSKCCNPKLIYKLEGEETIESPSIHQSSSNDE